MTHLAKSLTLRRSFPAILATTFALRNSISIVLHPCFGQISFIANLISADLPACGYLPVANWSQPRLCLSIVLDTVDGDVSHLLNADFGLAHTAARMRLSLGTRGMRFSMEAMGFHPGFLGFEWPPLSVRIRKPLFVRFIAIEEQRASQKAKQKTLMCFISPPTHVGISKLIVYRSSILS